MGLVYKAEDLRLKRIVALKFLPPALTTDPEATKRFINEAQAASSLQHNNICSIHDIDETEDGRMFICMDFYEGETLKAKIERGPLSIEETVDITIQLARGLADAHEHGIIHRDIKPANILITGNGVVKILDFGLAKLVGGTVLTGEGTTLGTAAYASPEQLLGEEVDARSDIFTIGIIVFEMLTQKLPFKGGNAAALMYSVMADEPLSLKEFRNDVPENLIKFCEQCLKKDSNHRPPTVVDAIHILGITEKVKIIVARRWHHVPRWMRVGAVASAIIVAAISLWLARPLFIPSSGAEEVKPVIAVFPFRNLTGRSEAAEWPSIIQNMIIDGFLGVEELAVIDQLTLNNFIEGTHGTDDAHKDRKLFNIINAGNAQYVVDGSITYSGNRYVIKYDLVDPSAGGSLTTTEPITIGGVDSLSFAARILSNKILNYLQVKLVSAPTEKDIRPWIARGSQNIEALREFIQASQLIFNGMPGAPVHERRAIELDSSFIAPRIWLISSLLQHGGLEEARVQYETLKRLEPSANPFERALIDCAGAYIAQDTIAQIRYLKIALDYSPGNNVLSFALAQRKTYIKDYKGAIDALRPSVKMKWQYSAAYYLLANCYDQLKDFTEAKKVLEESLTLRWVYYDIYRLLSVYALRDGDTVKVREYESAYLNGGKELGLPVHYLYAVLGSNNLAEGFYNSTIDYYKMALSLEPENAAYRDEFGEAFLRLGDREAARREFLLAARLDSTEALAYGRNGELNRKYLDSTGSVRHYTPFFRHDSRGSHAVVVR